MNHGLRHIVPPVFVAACIVHIVWAGSLEYPETQRVDHVDVYHGVEVADPYRWLEEDVRESERVHDWVDAQNKVTFEYLQSLPKREQIKKRLTELWDYQKYSVPGKAGGRYYIARNDGLQNHDVIYVMDSLDGPRRVLLNPNKWSKDGTTALGGMSFSEDGRFVAYAVQDAGSDWRTWKIRDIETGEDLADTLNYLKFTGAAWAPKSDGVFYAKYPDPDPNEQFTSLNKKMKVMYHRLGTSQENDVVVFYRPDHPEWGYAVKVTDDGRYLILTIWVGTDDKYRIMYKDLDQPYAMPIDLIDNFENDYSFIDNDGPVFFFGTDLEAPNRRVIAIDTRRPECENWEEIIAETREPLQSAGLVNNLLVCTYLKDVATQARLYTMNGRHLRDVELPGLGTAAGFGGKRRDTETFYSFQSFAVPPSIFRYDLVTGESELLEQAKVGFDP
ncbi:MAG: prolyl oligopeptidase family protein, partial [Planctomycetota bacterium]